MSQPQRAYNIGADIGIAFSDSPLGAYIHIADLSLGSYHIGDLALGFVLRWPALDQGIPCDGEIQISCCSDMHTNMMQFPHVLIGNILGR